MKQMINKIIKVKPEVKEYMLKMYIKMCRQKHSIAFLEWRLYFSQMRRKYTTDDDSECCYKPKTLLQQQAELTQMRDSEI